MQDIYTQLFEIVFVRKLYVFFFCDSNHCTYTITIKIHWLFFLFKYKKLFISMSILHYVIIRSKTIIFIF
jgi:hypothetical protein